MFNLLKNFHDFIKEIEDLKLQNESENLTKHFSRLNVNNIATNINEKITIENNINEKITIENNINEKITNENNINEINANIINENKNNNETGKIIIQNKNEKFIFLFSSIGKELFINSNIIQEKSKLENELVIKNVNNCHIILNKNKLIYSVVIRTNELKKNNKLFYVYSLYEYCKENYPNYLKFFVKVNFLKKKFKILKISILNLNNEVWNFSFTKNNIKDKLENLNNSKCLCFILFYNLLIKEYRLYISDIIKKFKKKKKSIFIIVKKEEVNNSNDYKKEEHIYENKKTYNLICNEHIYDTLFFNKIYVIFNLLREENIPFLKFYNLENYTRIFIYNCENLNKNNFINFLRSFENFHIYLINLNTLFGLYFSETEKNILNVFKKCQKILRNSKKNVCLVIDGIDIIAKNISKEKEECLDENNEKYDNNNSRILTTLLLCLDSIDNCTLKKKKFSEKELNQSIKNVQKDERNKKKKIVKNNLSFLDDDDDDDNDNDNDNKSSNESKILITHSLNNTKKKKSSEQITYNIKKLEKIYKERYIQSLKKKTKNNISIIVLSDLNLKCFDISLTRAGRFFHYIKYS
ncbi:conserved Plasmodium protein, unknown function [Plasmodium gallinaceum]|uniref:ATPase AAA-type core domain-containing protein n=1 Tax=Plasmodium gallinaceum TaxID=5849 RepID=A0A1J1GWH3_PLAGA|nr:conserved Plasmodium protein, unknown function [Plasmodium gallinaceum]CRG95357.1 conserved Plasmodium protein, unknown function [Plasmodium gallinaceum]